jgi:hypothetical protein
MPLGENLGNHQAVGDNSVILLEHSAFWQYGHVIHRSVSLRLSLSYGA